MEEMVTVSDPNGSRRFVVLEKVNYAHANDSGFLKGKLYLRGGTNIALMVYEMPETIFEDLPSDETIQSTNKTNGESL